MQKFAIFRLIVLSLTLSVLGVGYAGVQYNDNPIIETTSEPPENQINIANVGDILLHTWARPVVEAIEFPKEVKFGLSGSKLTKGHYVKFGEDEGSEYFRPSQLEGSGKLIKGPLVVWPFESLQVLKGKSKICAITSGGESCRKNIQYQRVKVIADPYLSVHMQLKYLGRSGNNITILYRVFLDYPAKGEKKETIEHNLESSNIFKKKYAILEVLDATDQSIEYKVLNNFTKKELLKHVDEYAEISHPPVVNGVYPQWEWEYCFANLGISEGDQYRSGSECGLCINHFYAGNAPSSQVLGCQSHPHCNKSTALSACLLSGKARTACPPLPSRSIGDGVLRELDHYPCGCLQYLVTVAGLESGLVIEAVSSGLISYLLRCPIN